MNTREAFLAEIIDNPDDDASRLVYADWLEDNGDPQRADFIRTQCRAAALDEDDFDRFELEEHALDLLAEHGPHWLAEIPEQLRGESLLYRRGFVAEAHLRARTFVAHGEQLLASTPLESLTLFHVQESLQDLVRSRLLASISELRPDFNAGQPTGVPGLLDVLLRQPLPQMRSLILPLDRADGPTLCRYLGRWPGLSGIEALSLAGCRIWDQGASTLLGSAHRGGLRKLNLSSTQVTANTARLISQREGLTDLDLSHDTLSAYGGAALAGSERLASLRSLSVGEAGLGIDGARALLWSPHLAGLRRLDLHGNVNASSAGELGGAVERGQLANLVRLDLSKTQLRDPGALALARSANLARLAVLDLCKNGITDRGACALAESPHLDSLHTLLLIGNPIGKQGLLALVDSPNLARLRRLAVESDPIAPAAVREMTACEGAARLRRLDLDRCTLFGAGAAALAGSPHLAGLRHLSLSGCRIESSGAAAIANSPHLRELRELSLTGNGIGPEGAVALAESPTLSRLRVLRLSGNEIGPEGVAALVKSPYLTRLMRLEVGQRGIDEAQRQALRERFGPAVLIG